jgi:hypothetical protein
MLQVHKLDILKKSRDDQSSVLAASPASLLWSLLDYSSSTTPSLIHDPSSATVELNVTTQFLSAPLNSTRTTQAEQSQESEAATITSASSNPIASTQVESDLSTFDDEMSIFDWNSMGEIQASSLGGEFWSEFGQL